MNIAKVISLALLGFSVAGIVFLQEKKPNSSLTENITFGFNDRIPTFSPEAIQLMSFGYSRVFSNLLWLRFLQQTPPKAIPENQLSWIYFDLDSITNVDSDFLPAYDQGGGFLSVVTSDKIGAKKILEKGVTHFPNNWKLRTFLAYHYYYELGDQSKAGEQYLIASKIPGAPPIVGMLAARYLAQTISPEASIELLESFKKNSSDELIKKRLQDRIDFWKKKILEKKNG